MNGMTVVKEFKNYFKCVKCKFTNLLLLLKYLNNEL